MSDIIDTSALTISDPLQLLLAVEQSGHLRKSFTEEVADASAENDTDGIHRLLEEIDSEKMVQALEVLNGHMPYNFQPYIVKEDVIEAVTMELDEDSEEVEVIPFLVRENGMGTFLHRDESLLRRLVTEVL